MRGAALFAVSADGGHKRLKMVGIVTGSLIISLLHALIPSHWLPVLAIGRKECWSLAETSRITLIAGLAHVVSTVLVGVLLGMIGVELAAHLEHFGQVVAPCLLILVGLYFIRQHYRHRHFEVEEKKLAKKTKRSIITALVVAMFLSPCLEIEAYFLMAGTKGWMVMALLALLYSVITLCGMLVWVRVVYKGLIKLNWHRWEHSAGIVTGWTLIITGIISFFIQ